MTLAIYDDKVMYDIADELRMKTQTDQKYLPSEMARVIHNLDIRGKFQIRNVVPTKQEQVITPEQGFQALEKVNVAPIPAEFISTEDATALADEIAVGKTAYVKGVKVTGTNEATYPDGDIVRYGDIKGVK